MKKGYESPVVTTEMVTLGVFGTYNIGVVWPKFRWFPRWPWQRR